MCATKGESIGMSSVGLRVAYPSTICLGILRDALAKLAKTMKGVFGSISFISFVSQMLMVDKD